MKTVTLSILSLLMLSACMNANTTGIQRGYVTMRDTCRVSAETQFGYAKATGGAAAQKDAGGTLAQLFSNCMESKGWAVASTKGKGRPGTTPPLDSIYDLPQTPGGRGPAASVSTAKEVPQAVQPVQPQGYAQRQIVQPNYNGLSPEQQQALYQQYLGYYSQQPQLAPQQYYQQPQQQQYYQQPQQQYAPQSYYQPQQEVEPLQHSATSLHLSRGGAGTSIGGRVGGARAK